MNLSASCPSCTAKLCPVPVPAARLGWNPHTSAQPQIAAGFLADARQHTLHCRARARVRLIARAEEAAYGTTWNIPQDSYIVLVRPSPRHHVTYSAWDSPLRRGSRCSRHFLTKAIFCWQGLAHCFEKDDNGKLKDVMVIEPLAANSLEGMMAGAIRGFAKLSLCTLHRAQHVKTAAS